MRVSIWNKALRLLLCSTGNKIRKEWKGLGQLGLWEAGHSSCGEQALYPLPGPGLPGKGALLHACRWVFGSGQATVKKGPSPP